MEANGGNGNRRTRVYLGGNGAAREQLWQALAGRAEFELVDASEAPALNGNVDVVLHSGDDATPLAAELSVLRSKTDAPIVLGAPADHQRLLDQALGLDLADVVLLPQSGDAIAFAVRRAAHGHAHSRNGVTKAGRLLTVFSPKGGTGKTVLATNLAASLAAQGTRTLLVDLDVQFGDVAIMVGVETAMTIRDAVTAGGVLDADKLTGYVATADAGFSVLAAPSRPEHSEAIDASATRLLLDVAKDAYEAVVVDTAPMFDGPTLAALEASDEVLVVVTPEVPALKNVRLGLETLERLGFTGERLSVVCNRIGERSGLGVAEVANILRRKPRFTLPDDGLVADCMNRGRPVVAEAERSPFARAVTAMAGQLLPVAAEPAPERRRLLRRSR